MAEEDKIADDLIPGGSKKSPSDHSDYGKKTYRKIKELAKKHDKKAKQMKKLIEEASRLSQKPPKRR